MKIQPVNLLGRFVVQKQKKSSERIERPFPQLSKDTVSFNASLVGYIKKYNTLPDDIKKILLPKDAIDMFMNMEFLQKGKMQGRKIGQGSYGRVYANPWLKGYYTLIVQDPNKTTQVVYSRCNLGDAVWQDGDNQLIQIIKDG